MSLLIDSLRQWLNNSRDYTQGVMLFCRHSDNEKLKGLFVKGCTNYTQARLSEELERLYAHEISTLDQSDASLPVQNDFENSREDLPARQSIQHDEQTEEPGKNIALISACNEVANKLWKEMMNDRAVLFNLTKVDSWDDINNADLVEKRKALALQICKANYNVSQAYDDLAHARQFGSLPSQPEPPADKPITDVELKMVIDNLRKNIGKIKNREQTPERILLLQRHQHTLQALLERWDAIKSTGNNAQS